MNRGIAAEPSRADRIEAGEAEVSPKTKLDSSQFVIRENGPVAIGDAVRSILSRLERAQPERGGDDHEDGDHAKADSENEAPVHSAPPRQIDLIGRDEAVDEVRARCPARPIGEAAYRGAWALRDERE